MIPILTYHAIGDGPPPLWLSTTDFEAQLDAMTNRGYRTIGLDEIATAIRGGVLPEKRFAITFDDGYANVIENAWPILRDRGLGATVFVITSRAGRDNRWPGQPSSVPTARLLDWDEIARLAEEGCTIGSHGRTHSLLDGRDASALEDEIASSREEIETKIGRPVESFAYPYGFVASEALAVARRHYAAAVGVELRAVERDSDPHRLPRVDACTIGPSSLGRIGEGSFTTYLAVRRMLRSVKRIVVKDWDPASMGSG